MLLQFPPTWHRRSAWNVPGCFLFPLTSFPHTDAASCVHQRAWPHHRSGGREVAFFCFVFFASLDLFLCFVFFLSSVLAEKVFITNQITLKYSPFCSKRRLLFMSAQPVERRQIHIQLLQHLNILLKIYVTAEWNGVIL